MNREKDYDGTEIAIISMAGCFPGADNLIEYWKNLCKGKESITFFSDDELIRTGVDSEVIVICGILPERIGRPCGKFARFEIFRIGIRFVCDFRIR